jgi:hypothetical protein
MLYYANALPQFATKLLRIDTAVTGDIVTDFEAWKTGRAETWSVRDGWTRYSGAQAEILGTGDWDGIDPGEVAEVQAHMLATHDRFHAK